ncbi:hypothetical protein BDV95DRAFT_76028 [Massariosphaeria phaeospora]|uniref:Effector 5 n=1 Tax=Massariosphaeria phaeospora TaxID=100035 RepID=A0A7C8ID72_9PLEO|nr:hypothetical protein BDV95DRAFT_76028 [Massariosphaeria phaeospora]
MGIQYTTDISKAKNIWVGDDSDWTTTFTNSASEPVVVFCWEKKPGDFTAMTLNKHKPAFNVGIKPNEKVTVAWAAGAFACAPAYGDTKMAQFGAVDNTWFEMNVHKGKATSVFNVSRNVNLNGNTITAVGSKCTSSMEKCFFKCMNGQVSCEFGYTLVGMNTDPGCHGDYDPVMKGDGGGCQMTDDSDHVDVNFSS